MECALSHLKVHRHALRMCLEVEEENLRCLIITTCILYTICEIREEVFHKSWAKESLHADQTWCAMYAWHREAGETKPPDLGASAPHRGRESGSVKP